MDQTSYHQPVMVETVLELFAPVAQGLIVDGTLGGAGHAVALLDRYPELEIIGIDRDPDAIAAAPLHPRLRVARANFTDLARVVADEGGTRAAADGIDGVLLDLGISSHQVDTPQRGFSYRLDGPLDMRMGQEGGDAEAIVNTWPREELVDIFRRYGEERFATRIADAIVAARPVEGTGALAEIVAGSVPAKARRPGHPARRVFQALRIAVNDELGALADGLDAAVDALRPEGRLVVIAYHSLEDRMVKQRFAAGATGCTCPPDLPVCGCGNAAELRLLGRHMSGAAEVAANPRARSAVLRGAEKVGQ